MKGWKRFVGGSLVCVTGLCLNMAVWAGETLHVGLGGKPNLMPNLNYTDGQGSANKTLIINLVESLVTQNPDGDVIPAQAERWEVKPGGREMHFFLRKEALWSNGEPVRAQDFVLAWQQLVDPANNRRMNGLLRLVKHFRAVRTGELPPEKLGVSVLDDRTLVVHLTGASDLFLKMLVHHPTAPIYSRQPERFPDASAWMAGVGESKLYNGPYVPAATQKGRVVFKANPHYYDRQQLYFDQVVWKGEAKHGKLIKSVLDHDVDVALSNENKEIQWIEKHSPELNIATHHSLLLYYIFHRSSALKTYPDIRRAINMTLYREGLRYSSEQRTLPTYRMNDDSMYQSRNLPQPDWVSWGYAKRLQQAQTLVQNSGFSKERPFKLKVLALKVASTETLLLSMKSMLGKIGVELSEELLKTREYARRLKKGDYESAIIGWIKDFDDPYSHLSILYSGNSYYQQKLGSGIIDQQIKMAIQIDNAARREQAYLRIEAQNQNENIIIPLLLSPRFRIADPDIENAMADQTTLSVRWMKRKAH